MTKYKGIAKLKLNYLLSGQQYKDDLSNLLHGFVSLSPLITSIQEFSLAAKDAEVEVQVNPNNIAFYFYFLNIFWYSLQDKLVRS